MMLFILGLLLGAFASDLAWHYLKLGYRTLRGTKPRFYIEYNASLINSYMIKDNERYDNIVDYCQTYEQAVEKREELEQAARQVKQTMKELNK